MIAVVQLDGGQGYNELVILGGLLRKNYLQDAE
jgi:hypothetical protein